MRESINKWGTRVGLFGAAVFGPGVGFYEHVATENGWEWDWNENTAVALLVLAALSAIFFGGPQPKAHTVGKRD